MFIYQCKKNNLYINIKYAILLVIPMIFTLVGWMPIASRMPAIAWFILSIISILIICGAIFNLFIDTSFKKNNKQLTYFMISLSTFFILLSVEIIWLVFNTYRSFWIVSWKTTRSYYSILNIINVFQFGLYIFNICFTQFIVEKIIKKWQF